MVIGVLGKGFGGQNWASSKEPWVDGMEAEDRYWGISRGAVYMELGKEIGNWY